MGIILDERYQRQGLCLEVHLSCLKNAFEVLGLREVFFMTSHDNNPMRSFLTKFKIAFVGLVTGQLVPKRSSATGTFTLEQQEP